MALPMASPNLHAPTQSAQFFGGFQLAKSIHQNQSKQSNWICSSCGCDNMGKSTVCGLCGALHSKYDDSVASNTNNKKKVAVKNAGSQLLISRDVFKKCSQHFPAWHRYQTIAAPMSSSTQAHRGIKPPPHKQATLFDFDSSQTRTLDDYDRFHRYKSTSHPNPNAHIADFIETIFDDIAFDNPFGVAVDDDDDIPTIVSDDEDIDDLPLDVLRDEVDDDDDGDGNDDAEQLITAFDIDALTQRLNANISVYNKRESTVTANNRMSSKGHVRQQSFSVPSSPKHNDNLRTIVRINRKEPPLLIGVVHVPSPSRKDRVEIVLRNVQLIAKHEFDGAVLINHGYSANALVPIIHRVHSKYPLLWLGANFLGVSEKKIFKFLKTHRLHTILKGVWCENGGIELLQEELDDIFIRSFHRTDTSSRTDLHLLGSVDDAKECDDNGFAMPNLLKSSSDKTDKSSGSGQSGGGKRKVAFTDEKRSTPKAAVAAELNNKREDRGARTQLLRMRKAKFDGLLFGGVDLTPQQRIKIPSQKSIRTRRRTYSTSIDVERLERGLTNNKDSPSTSLMPRSFSTHTSSTVQMQRLSKHRNVSFESRVSGKSSKRHRSKSHKFKTNGAGGGSARERKRAKAVMENEQKKTSKNGYGCGHQAKKRSSSQGLQVALADLSELVKSGTAAGGGAKTKGKKSQQQQKRNTTTRMTRAHTDHMHDKPRELMKLNMLISSSCNADADVVLATIAADENPKPNHKNNILKKPSMRTKHNIRTKNNNILTKHVMHKSKSAAQQREDEKEDDIRRNLKKTRSHDRIDTSARRPRSPTDSAIERGGGHGALVLPRTPSTPMTSKKQLQSLYQHRPLDGNLVESLDMDAVNGSKAAWFSSIATDPQYLAQISISLDRASSSHSQSPGAASLHSYSSNEEVGSIYSHTSHTSHSWSEFGSVTETLDDYFEALHRLGTFASNGYMHVITTSGKGPNIEIKLKALSQACHKKCLLAVASGVRMDNIQNYVPFCDILMVSTCISNDFHHFDGKKMAKFKKTVHTYLQNLDTL